MLCLHTCIRVIVVAYIEIVVEITIILIFNLDVLLKV